MKLNATEKNAFKAVEYLLSQAEVKVTSIGLEEELVMHPDFPSLAAVSDAFHEWGIPSLATRITTEQLMEIPLPAIAYLDIRGGIMAPVKSVREETIEWLDTQQGWQKENIASFSQKWHGTILLIEPNKNSGEINFKLNNRTQRHAGIRTTLLP